MGGACDIGAGGPDGAARLAGTVVAHHDGALVHVHLQPGAGRDGLSGRHGDAVKLRVRAPAVDGRANEAALRLLAELLDVPRSDLRLAGGERSRAKRVVVSGVGAVAVRARLAELIGALGRS